LTVAGITAINEHLTTSRFEKSCNELEQGGFATAGVAHQQAETGSEVGGEISQDGLAPAISVAELLTEDHEWRR